MNVKILLIALVLLQGRRARAQGPQISAVWPPGGTFGARVEARIEGSGLAGTTAALISGRGITLKMNGAPTDGSIPVSLEIASDAPPGPREVRLITPKGVTNPGYVWAGALPETAEVEPNDQPEQAQQLSNLPVTVYGRANRAEDVDWYSIHATAGDTFVFEVCANRIYSPIDPFLELRDSQGHLLATAMEGYDRDPRMIHTFKKDGAYRLHVRDTMYRGGNNFVYRLNVGKLPTITSIFPPGGRLGEKMTAAVEGVNLGQMTSMTVDLAVDLAESRPVYVQPQTPNGPALPVTVVGDWNPQVAVNPIGAMPPVSILSLPLTVNSRFTAPKQVQTYVIQAAQGQPVDIAFRARAIGSRVDGYLRVLDSKDKELINTDDQIPRDPRLTFNPPQTGSYKIEVTNLNAKGGPDYYYRLSIEPPGAPDFRLRASPDAVMLGHGQTMLVDITATRRGGFNGEIVVRVEGLPAGISVSPLTLAPGQSAGQITLTAAADAPLNGSAVRVIGEGSPGGQKVTRTATPIASLPRPGEGQVVPRIVEFQMAAVTDAIPLYTLSVESTQIALKPGESVMVKVKAARKPNDNNANGAIALTLANLPAGVTAEAPAIPEKQGEATIKLTAAGSAGPATQSAILTGKLGENVQPAPALVISVTAK